MPPNNMHGKLMLILCNIIIYIPADKHMLVEARVDNVTLGRSNSFFITTTHDYQLL